MPLDGKIILSYIYSEIIPYAQVECVELRNL